MQAVINALRQFNATTAVNYLLKNQARMDYPRYRALKLPTSSGRVESACKNVIGARFKKGGMHWSLNGTRNMLAVRCRIESNELGAWYNDLHTTQQAALALLSRPVATAT